jgi:hypothetical protein
VSFAASFLLTAFVLGHADPAATRARAAARYANHDFGGALEDWNTLGEPHVGAIRVHDAKRTSEAAVLHLAGLSKGELLTHEAFNRARRRLHDWQAATATIDYTSNAAGVVDVDIHVDENTLAPTGLFGLGEVAGKAIILSDIQVPLTDLLHRGDVLTVAYRWPSDWRRFLVDLSVPSPRPVPGLADVQGLWERQTYETVIGSGSSTAPVITEDHAQAAASLSDWVAGVLRWQGGVTFDEWNDRHHVGVTGLVDLRLFGDRVSVGTDDAMWAANAHERGFGKADVWMAWRSTPNPQHADVTIFAEGITTSATAPFDLWSGAGSGVGRPSLLRAHSEIEDNVIGGEFFGRSLVHFTTEYHRPVGEIMQTTIRWALFADTARASHRVDGTESSWPLDVGTGIRWGVPGLGSEVRLDLARGLRDGGWAISVGWQAPWPRQ